jgi:Tfp pilus assembly protein PilV
VTDQSRGERGSVLIEVLVSAIVLTIAALGAFNAFDSSTRATSQERHRAQAHGIAQKDLARMRTMRISALSNLDETRQVTVDGSLYTVESVATFQTDATGTASCGKGEASADYIRIRSTVTWPSIGSREPVEEQSLVAPPNGSISPDSGGLAVQVEGAGGTGVANVGIAGSQEGGGGSFSGSTGPDGCVIFGNLPAGNYNLDVLDSSLVDNDGNPPETQPTSVVAESVNTLALQYDEPGRIDVGFETWVEGEPTATDFDSVVVFNTGMSVAKTFGTPGAPQPEVSATNLFPFASPYAVYAGNCAENNPNPGGEPEPPPAIQDALVSRGGVTPVTLALPPLDLTAWSGESESEPGAPVEGARVKVADTRCTEGEEGEETPIVRTYTTNEAGGLDDPGLPYSEYDLCVEYGEKHIAVSGVSVPEDPADVEAGTPLDFYLGNPEAETGPCP